MTEPDTDALETTEWLESLLSVIEHQGIDRARFLLNQLEKKAEALGIRGQVQTFSAYRNTIPVERQQAHPGDVEIEERLIAIMRWNALAMVTRANNAYGELGGHIASYASGAELFETGFNHFFRASIDGGPGDLLFLQPHSAPGIYARAFLEGRLSNAQLEHFRRELSGPGLCSYPHPWLMPDFWQFPTGSMGLGPLNAIYQAKFLRYLAHRGLAASEQRRVWGIFGDGEMDEPESLAALTLAARESLDNLTFVINCNLQRLDGPVRGNGQIIQELESLFRGAGWNVVKVLWGSDWDALFARDTQHALVRQFADTVDGQYQTLGANDGAYNRDHFFKLHPDLQALVAHLSVAEINALKRGGHDLRKVYAAMADAVAHRGQPTVILAKTKKGYGMGRAGESRMTAHQEKKLDVEALLDFRNRFRLPISDAEVAELRFYRPPPGSEELRYLTDHRQRLGGYMPARVVPASALAVPRIDAYAAFALAGNDKAMSTTMVFVRMLTALLRDPVIGPRIVPIVADEARTFGMATLFRQIGIYASQGQLYEPEDAGSLLAYREARNGQLLEEGITEAGALASWTAAATSYSAHGMTMLPFYIYYSMFGFQRVADLIWAAADQRARGFLLGATAGRTTLGGEGLQHQDGSSHVYAATVPTCRAYDPAYGYELAVILDHGMQAMLVDQEDVFFYVTVMNESYPQPNSPNNLAEIRAQLIRGMYRLPALLESSGLASGSAQIRLLGSGAILREVCEAARMLQEDWQVSAEVWSVTSYSELAREARAAQRWNRLHPDEAPKMSHVAACLGERLPVVATTDYVRALPQLIAEYVDAEYLTLGTDGFGRSDTRSRLRRFFEVDRYHVVLTALDVLARQGAIDRSCPARAITRYGIDQDLAAPWTC